MQRPLKALGSAICAIVVAITPTAAQRSASFPDTELERLLPALSDSMRPLARAVLAAPSGSEDQLKAARGLYEFVSHHRFDVDSAPATDFVRLWAVSDAALPVRALALYSMGALSGLSDGCPPDTAAIRLFRSFATTDTSKQVRSIAIGTLGAVMACDHQSFAIYRQVMTSDPSVEVRRQAVSGLASMRSMPPAMRLPEATVKDLLLARVAADTSSAVVTAAIEAYQQIVRDTALSSVLAARIAQQGGSGAPRWLAAVQQRLRDARRNTIPWFMREAPPVFAALPAKTARVRLFALGDWGDSNAVIQQQVSAAVRTAHRRTPFHFGLALGDNFYEEGLDSPRHPRWQLEYEQQYGVLGIPIYAVLGNHEYSSPTAPAAEIAYTGYSKTWRMPATHYTFTAGPAQFFMIDTQSLTPWQLGWLDSALATSRAPWKIVVGHYDLYSNRQDSTGAAVEILAPLFRKYGVQAYLNGHYHTLQHHQVQGTEYVTSGAGARGLYKLYEADSAKYQARRKFAARSHGFAVADVTSTTFVLQFRDADGKELYRYERRR